MKYLIAFVFVLFSASSFSEEPKHQHLDDFDTVESFEKYLVAMRKSCLDKSYGGSKSPACFSNYSQAWDIELNYFYKLVRSKLNEQEKQILKTAQLAWIKYRDKTKDFNSLVLDKKYEDKRGTMYIAMRANDASRAITPIIKKRAILLKKWYDTLNKI